MNETETEEMLVMVEKLLEASVESALKIAESNLNNAIKEYVDAPDGSTKDHFKQVADEATVVLTALIYLDELRKQQ